ncbi:MAG TPA: N-acetylmuramoyl-L-alanine amidase [Chloroflexota bacterium]|nr:N-acetylmuramoyl-L-alanine amidase [Chloroflexota bacterium]
MAVAIRWILVVAACQAPTLPSSARARAPTVRAAELAATRSDVAADSLAIATFESAFAFQAFGILWTGDAPTLEERVVTVDGTMGGWHEVEIEDDFPPVSGGNASKLIIGAPAIEAQVRVSAGAAGRLPADLRIVAIDPSGGQPDPPVAAARLGRAIDPAIAPGNPLQVPVPTPPPATPFSPFAPIGTPRPTPAPSVTPAVTPLPPGVAPSAPSAPSGPPIAAPRIIARSDWGADPQYLTWTPEFAPARKFAIHHTVTSDGGNDPAAAIRAIYYYHAVTLGWGDIGYNYLIDRSGNIYEGRAGGPNVVAGHAAQYSSGADGIALLGTYQDDRPTDAMLAALVSLIAWRARAQGVDPLGSSFFVDKQVPNIFGHRDVMSTDCPGDAAYALLPTIRQRVATYLATGVLPTGPIGPITTPSPSPSVPQPRPSVSVVGARFSPTSLSAMDVVRVDITVANTGASPVTTQGPDPGAVYDEKDSYLSVGQPEQPGRIRVGVELDGGGVIDRRFRWGLGQDLGPGQTRTVTGFIRFDEPGAHTLWAGIVDEGVAWLQDRVAPTSVTVWTPGASSYAAIAAPSSTVYFPLAMRGAGGWSTRLVVASAADAPLQGSLALIAPDGATAAAVPFALQGRAAAQFDLATLTGLPDGFVGSAVVQADGPVAGVAFQERANTDRMAVEGVSHGWTTLYAPLIAKNYHGLSTGIQVQNLGSEPGSVSVTLIQDNGATWSETAVVAPLAAATFYTPANDSLPDGFVGSAVIESTDGQPMAAYVNEIRSDGVAMSYAARAGGSQAAVAPLLYRRRNGWNSGLQVQNLGAGPADVLATYMQTDGSGGPWEQRGFVGFGISATFYLPAALDLPDNLVASAIVRALEGQPLLTLAQTVNAVKKTGTAVGSSPDSASTLFVPWFTNDRDGWRSGVQVVNLLPRASPISLRFTDPRGGLVYQTDDVIPGSGARTFYSAALTGLPAGFGGSLTISAAPGSALSAVVNDVR